MQFSCRGTYVFLKHPGKNLHVLKLKKTEKKEKEKKKKKTVLSI